MDDLTCLANDMVSTKLVKDEICKVWRRDKQTFPNTVSMKQRTDQVSGKDLQTGLGDVPII